VFSTKLAFLLIFLLPVCRNITGVRRELHDVGIIQQFTLQPFALSVVLYTKPARKRAVTKKKIIYKTKILKNKNMKTSIKSLIALVATGLVLTTATINVKADDNTQVTVLSDVKKVNKINVSGNVELILVQSADESVKVYDNYFSKNALVQQKDGELRISSFNKETLTVVVYVNSLTSISASNNATVKTLGKFSTLSLDVNLKDEAKATLNTNTISLSTNVADQANLTLSGSTTDYNAVMGSVAKVNMGHFVAETTNIQSKNVSIAKVAKAELPTTDDLVNL
jgi:hypothetical protein